MSTALTPDTARRTETSAEVRRPREALRWLPDAFRPTWLPNHYPALHGLRVLAIILVVQLHTTWALLFIGVVSFSTESLWFGMDLFFILSGFLIGSMLLADSPSGRPVKMRRFYVRRTFRIFPSYLVALTLFAWMWPMNPIQRGNLWKEYAYLTNYVPPVFGSVVMPWGWSLALEEHFCLVVPVLIAGLRRLRSPRTQLLALLALWVSAPLVRLWMYLYRGPWNFPRMFSVIYVQSHLRYDILVAGIFTACVQHYYRDALTTWLERKAARALFGGVSAIAFALLAFTAKLQHEFLPYDLLCWGTITSLAYVPLVLLLLNHESAFSRALSHRFFGYIATFGYGIYLIHTPIIDGYLTFVAYDAKHSAHLPWQLIWPLTILATLCLSAVGAYVLHILV